MIIETVMAMHSVEIHLRVVGGLLLGIAVLGVYVPRHFGWARHIQPLPLLTRQVFVIHCWFVSGVCGLLGLLLSILAPALLAPGALPRALLIGLLAMWGARMFAQWLFYDARLWRGIPLHTFMHVLFSAIYIYFVATFAAACNSRVYLPIPGSPPIRVADPATSPPPSARSSSAIPVEMRAGSTASASSPLSSTLRPPLRRSCLAEKGVTTPAASSTRLFHSPQSAHCPAQRGLTDPHNWQT